MDDEQSHKFVIGLPWVLSKWSIFRELQFMVGIIQGNDDLGVAHAIVIASKPRHVKTKGEFFARKNLGLTLGQSPVTLQVSHVLDLELFGMCVPSGS
jgi:hypothetical protein